MRRRCPNVCCPRFIQITFIFLSEARYLVDLDELTVDFEDEQHREGKKKEIVQLIQGMRSPLMKLAAPSI